MQAFTFAITFLSTETLNTMICAVTLQLCAAGDADTAERKALRALLDTLDGERERRSN